MHLRKGCDEIDNVLITNNTATYDSIHTYFWAFVEANKIKNFTAQGNSISGSALTQGHAFSDMEYNKLEYQYFE